MREGAVLAALSLAGVLLVGTGFARGQVFTPPRAEKLEQAARLAMLKGLWEGSGTVVTAQGTANFRQRECVRDELDGLVHVIRGTGLPATDESSVPVFEALMTVHYDPGSEEFVFRSHESRGGWTADGTMRVDGGSIEWEHPAGPITTMRYRIEISGDDWHETGTRVHLGVIERPFIELNLKRVATRCDTPS